MEEIKLELSKEEIEARERLEKSPLRLFLDEQKPLTFNYSNPVTINKFEGNKGSNKQNKTHSREK